MKKTKSIKRTENDEQDSQSPPLRKDADLFNEISIPVLLVDNNLLVLRINNAARGLFGSSIINVHFPALFKLITTDQKLVSLTDLFHEQTISGQEVSFVGVGKVLTFLISAAPQKDLTGITTGFTITLTDITNQIQDLKKLNIELKEKTFSLKEIHHRIKNNLQIINSILTLQMYYAGNNELSVLLTGLQARIRTIALIHEKLYQTDNPSKLNICYFLKDLQKILIQVYELNTDFIIFNCEIEEIVLDTDIVLQLGMIINELITNSIKYAFPSGKGIIYTSFKMIGDNYELNVKDDGIGMTNDILSHKAETLGSQLLETLIQQLNGSVKINAKNGTEYIISFPRI
jgi:two-component sensor histidine kinase